MSDHVVVDRKHAFKLPDSIPLDIGGVYLIMISCWFTQCILAHMIH